MVYDLFPLENDLESKIGCSSLESTSRDLYTCKMQEKPAMIKNTSVPLAKRRSNNFLCYKPKPTKLFSYILHYLQFFLRKWWNKKISTMGLRPFLASTFRFAQQAQNFYKALWFWLVEILV